MAHLSQALKCEEALQLPGVAVHPRETLLAMEAGAGLGSLFIYLAVLRLLVVSS